MQALMQEIKNVTLLALPLVLAFNQHELGQSKRELRCKMKHGHQPCCMYMYATQTETSLPMHCLHNQPSREEKISAPFCAYFFFTPTHISGYSRSDITSGSNNGGGDGISTS